MTTLAEKIETSVVFMKGKKTNLKYTITYTKKAGNNQQIGGQVQNGGGNNNNRGGGRLPFFLKCEDCQINNKFCTHCSKCGELGHKRQNCTKN